MLYRILIYIYAFRCARGNRITNSTKPYFINAPGEKIRERLESSRARTNRGHDRGIEMGVEVIAKGYTG